MKKIFLGRGLQYNVFRISHTRVLKVETTRAQKKAVVTGWGESPERIKKYLENGNTQLLSSLELIKQELARAEVVDSDSLFNLLGRPMFCQGTTSFSQDYGLPPIELVRRASRIYDLVYQALIRDYVRLLYKLWGYGLHDLVMNCYTNCSYLPDNRLILHDFGELTADYKTVRHRLKTEHFRNSSLYGNRSNTAQRKFLTTYFRRHLTIENLDKYWKTKK